MKTDLEIYLNVEIKATVSIKYFDKTNHGKLKYKLRKKKRNIV